MSELDLGGRKYHEVTREVAGVAEELLRKGADANAVNGAIEFVDREITSQMDDKQMEWFRARVVWDAAPQVIVDVNVESEGVYNLLDSLEIAESKVVTLAGLGKDIEHYNQEVPVERAHRLLRMAASNAIKFWESVKHLPLEHRIGFFSEEYVRIACLQGDARDKEGASQTAVQLVEFGKELLAEAHLPGNAEHISQVNDELIEAAQYLEGGMDNPLAQSVLRMTSHEGKGLNFLELRRLEKTADTLLKAGSIDAAFAVYAVAWPRVDAEVKRNNLQRHGLRTPEEIEEYIRVDEGSFRGHPWRALWELQQLPDTESYVDHVLDRIKSEFPTTYEGFSYASFCVSPEVFNVLMEVDRAEELAEIIRGNSKNPDELSNLRYMAMRMAVVLTEMGKDELYERVFEATKDVPGASDALAEGHRVCLDLKAKQEMPETTGV